MQYSQTASDPIPANAAGVVVVGETPYSEGFGDVGGPQWGFDPGDHGVLRPKQTMQLSDADTLAIRRVCSQAASCTVLVISGRPMIIPPEVLDQIDALVASWLPGGEGLGVADVLFGKKPFTGKLPVTWPRSRRPGADQRRRPGLRPALPVRVRARHLTRLGAVRSGGVAPLRVSGPVLPDGEPRDLYVVDGRITLEPQAGAETVASGWIVPGLVDAHCHIGLDEHGRGRREATEAQAVADRDAGALLLRDCGSPADTRWVQDRDDLPRLIRMGRHIARTRRYIRDYAHEVEPDELTAYVEQEARRGDGWVKLVGRLDRARRAVT